MTSSIIWLRLHPSIHPTCDLSLRASYGVESQRPEGLPYNLPPLELVVADVVNDEDVCDDGEDDDEGNEEALQGLAQQVHLALAVPEVLVVR